MLKLPSKFLQQHGSKIRDGLTVLKLVGPTLFLTLFLPLSYPNPNPNPTPTPTLMLILTLTRSPASANAPGCLSIWRAYLPRWSRWRCAHV